MKPVSKEKVKKLVEDKATEKKMDTKKKVRSAGEVRRAMYGAKK